MELVSRSKNDRYTEPGRYRQLESQLRQRVAKCDIPVLFMYAFDFRTRLGPFLFIDKKLIPGAPRAVASSLLAAGFSKLRVVLQQWSPRVRPSRAEVDGQPPEILFVSSMQIHSGAAYNLIRDAWTLGDDRPLILAGGPKAIYQPSDFFGLSRDGSVGADAVVTGEEYVLIELLERIAAHRGPHETMRQAFERVRQEGLLEDIPGLVYRPDEATGPPEYLVDTGMQQLVQDLDELPMPLEALSHFEPPHRRSRLSRRPLSADRIRRHAKVLTLVTTHGCKFRCPYCPIPAYNQFTFRHKSPERMVEEMQSITERTGINFFFGADDNFFNNRQSVEEIFTAMARGHVGQKPFRDAIFFGTEATEFDVHKNQDLLPLGRDAGLRAIWFGIEDMTAELVKKGQTPEKTKEVFRLLLDNGIAPMPMMMHHDGQPLWSRKGLYGLLNQVRYLKRAGALSLQVTFLMPAVGSKGYEAPYEDGMVMGRVGGRPVEDYQYDGNHCIATHDPHPWRKQANLMLSYAYFYNPVRWVKSALKFDSLRSFRLMYQSMGNLGVWKSLWQSRDWFKRLVSGPIEKLSTPPAAKYPLVAPAPRPSGNGLESSGNLLPVIQLDTPLPAMAACGD